MFECGQTIIIRRWKTCKPHKDSKRIYNGSFLLSFI